MRLRTSPERQTLLRVVKFAPGPLTSGEIRDQLPKHSEATFFRNLEKLVKRGEIFPVEGLDGKKRYVGHAWHEAEFRCQRCGKTRYLKSQTLPTTINRKMFGNQRVFVATMRASGLCASCLTSLHPRRDPSSSSPSHLRLGRPPKLRRALRRVG